MSDDIFNEGKKSINWPNVLLVAFLVIVIISIALYSTGHLNIGSNTNEKVSQTNMTNNNTSGAITTEELTQNETKELENNVVKVVLPKYVVYKTTSGDVLGVVGFIAIKTKYYNGMDDSVIIGLKNYPVRKTVISKQLYSKDYNGYVVYKFTITFKDTADKTLQNLKTLQLLVIYNNIPYTFDINMTKNVKLLKSNYEISMDYNIPVVTTTPVQASVTFNIITNSQALLNKIKNDIINNYQSSYIVLEGDEKYYVRATTYNEAETSVTIQYISSPNVMTGVYTATLHYTLLGNTYNKKLRKILVDNPNNYPDFASIGLIKDNGKLMVNKINGKYWLLVQINDTVNSMSIPEITFTYYDYNLNKISEYKLSNVDINFGVNIVNAQIPENLIEKPGKYYMIMKITSPSGNEYAVLFKLDTNEVTVKATDNYKTAKITYMLYPQEDYYNMEYITGQNNTVSGKIPLLIFYPSTKETITVKVTTSEGTQTVTLDRIVDYNIGNGEVAPLYGGFFNINNEQPITNYEITVELPDGEKVRGSVNLMNIMFLASTVNKIYHTTMIKTTYNMPGVMQSEELTAYLVIAVARGIDTEHDLNSLLSELMSNTILVTNNDVKIDGNKVIIKIDDGTTGILLGGNLITFKQQLMTMIRNINLIIRQNENLYYNIIMPAQAVYENRSVVITIPFLDKVNHIYIEIGNKLLALSEFKNTPRVQVPSTIDYTYYLYIDPTIKLTGSDELYMLYNTAFKDNPISRQILLEKLNSISLLYSYVQQLQNNYNTTVNNETVNNETIQYNNTVNTTARILAGEDTYNYTISTLHFYIGLDNKPTGQVSLIVNGNEVPATYTVRKFLDFYLVDVQVKYDDFEGALSGVTFNDIISGKQLIKLTIDGHTYINILPNDISTRSFLISSDLLFINSEGYTGVLSCSGKSLSPIYSVSINGFSGSVYPLTPGCELTVKSDYFGEYKVFP